MKIVSHVVPTLTVDGETFRDLDRDGVLSPFEDWRLTPAERAADLAKRLSVEEKAGLMIIGSHYPGDSAFLPNPVEGKLLNEEDVWKDKHPITGIPFPEPVLTAASSEKAVKERHQRYFIVRDNLQPRRLAEWTNAIQELAENTRFAIPAVFASNPRNHVSLVARFGVNESAGVFSEWPSELGLAALDDAELMREFGKLIAREWRAGGIHKLYGYMADVASEPRWSRFNGTFGEDTQLVADYIREVVTGMEEGGVATTIKHFPGGGVRIDGHDPHFPWGQTNEYPTEGALANYHLPPFQAAVDAGCTSIMPYYAKPVNTSAKQLDENLWQNPTTQFDEVAFAYNKTIIGTLLRDKMGFTGYINSDSGVIDAMVWGVEELSEKERFAKAVKAGTDIFSDMSNPQKLVDAVSDGLLTSDDLTGPATRLLTEIFSLGLFENPYVDPDEADKIVGNAETQALGEKKQRESVVILKKGEALPLDTSKKVYTFVTGRTSIGEVQEKLDQAVDKRFERVDLDSADIAIVWARPEIELFEDDQEGVSLSINPEDCGVDLEEVKKIQEQVPTIVVVNFTNPWILAGLEPGADSLVGSFEITPENLLDSLINGEAKGHLPFAIPASMETVKASPRDVPGKYLGDDYAYVDSQGNRYAYGFGL
ncbi:MAG: glycoside hydrolase family 3 N-terminal domain-containing protein [Corynebacterium glucuronolyticum]|nr:glycoside hydrolase family 3 protein [Corynebacterium glucuronolyticum]MDD7586481.1 glycoside hydrolase family 3 N-terminal domain-containing protein [Mycobacteriaceae bacterium]MDY5833691.1 glycoside hydrolase family 3 N-terminal domain-containing protein [Corynebacterium glucuronolyticum]